MESMTTWEVLVIYDQDDTYNTDVEAETIEDAARLVWDDWHPTGWCEAAITGPGPDDWGWINLDADAFNFNRNPTEVPIYRPANAKSPGCLGTRGMGFDEATGDD